MPQSGVSVPRSKVRRGDRWSDDLELEFPSRRESRERRAARAGERASARLTEATPRPILRSVESGRPEPVAALPADDPYDPYDLDLDLASWVDRAPARIPSPPARIPSPPARIPSPPASAEPAVRRTVTIQGRPSDRYRPPVDSRRRQPPPHYRAGFRPDRVAMWAVFLGLVLLLVAATSSHAAVLHAHTLASLTALS